ncbi:uncharacterized protein ACNLHF_020690 isoform 2-T2 [Anomaloglossus baeobatrachus]|uniref:uncharacterized protein LOC142311251 isoform X2 n=1 Tax=Anomaloglossus baeobatrachus TaxID=238106 RepID=UPI003F50519A
MEEWEHVKGQKDVMMENHKPLTTQDEPCERNPSPLDTHDCLKENHNVPQNLQGEDVLAIKIEAKVKEEDGMYMKTDLQYGSGKRTRPKRFPSPVYTQDCSDEDDYQGDDPLDMYVKDEDEESERCSSPHYSQECPEDNQNLLQDNPGEEQNNFKVEIKSEYEDASYMSEEQGREEEIPKVGKTVAKGGKKTSSRKSYIGKRRSRLATPRKVYRRMDMDVGTLISEVQARPLLWDKGSFGYTDRHRRDRAWIEICQILYPDWGGYSHPQQGVIEDDVRQRWKSVRDRFLKERRQAIRSGISLSKRRKMPFYDELLFIMPNCEPRTSQGSYHETDSLAESPAAHDELQQMESEPTPSTSAASIQKMELDLEDQVGLSWVATPPSPEEETPVSTTNIDAVTISTVSPIPVSFPVTWPIPPTRTASIRGRSRRGLRVTDRHLEGESEAMFLNRRVESNDRFDFFGFGLAVHCRQMRPEHQDDFMSFVHAAAGLFHTADSLPDLGDLINTLRWASGLRQMPPRSLPRPRVRSISVQTDPVNFSALHPPPAQPATGSQVLGSFYQCPPTPYTSSGPTESQPTSSSTSPDYSTPPYTN